MVAAAAVWRGAGDHWQEEDAGVALDGTAGLDWTHITGGRMGQKGTAKQAFGDKYESARKEVHI